MVTSRGVISNLLCIVINHHVVGFGVQMSKSTNE